MKELLQKPFLPRRWWMMRWVELVHVCVYLSIAFHLFQITTALHSYVLLSQRATEQTKEDGHKVIMNAEMQLIMLFIF